MPRSTKDGMLKRWRVAEPSASAGALASALGVHPLVAQVLCQRGFEGKEPEAARAFLEPRLSSLVDPLEIHDCDRAAERLARALRDREPVAIYGDYDVDGITATAILYHVIKAAAPDAVVHRYVPHRIEEGYGLNTEAIERLAADGARVIVTVDCGITAIEPAAAAAARGVDLIITDHHEPRTDGRLPEALAIVHPGLARGAGGRGGPSRDLCGAGVAYKLAWQLARAWCGSERVAEPFRSLLLDLLPLAALGTVADVVPLLDENRVITTFGLRRIKQTGLRGLNALIEAAGLRDAAIDSYHIGFVLGPRINACGRLGHARDAVDLLTTAGADEAARIARDLNAVNESRRAREREIFEQARRLVVERGDDHDEVRAIVLGQPGWHQGVVGIVCSRLVEAFGRPTILVDTMNETASGSARSIDGFNMIAALDACRAHLTTYGGHAMAAGLKLHRDELEAFRATFVRYAGEHLSLDDLVPALDVDAEATVGALTVELCRELERLGPFGRSNPAPTVIVRDVVLTQAPRPIGREDQHLELRVASGGRGLRCMFWGRGQLAGRLRAGARVDLVGEPKLNRFRGDISVELVLDDLRESQPA